MSGRPTRPGHGTGVFVTGTDTGVGKTHVAALVINALRTELKFPVAAMKPVETGVANRESPAGRAGGTESDARKLARAAGINTRDKNVMGLLNPYKFSRPLSPFHSARAENKLIDPAKILTAFDMLASTGSAVVVEGAGGIAVPITKTYATGDLARDMALPVLIVAGPYLGHINHLILTVRECNALGLDILGIVFSCARKDKPQKIDTNLIESVCGAEVFGVIGRKTGRAEKSVAIKIAKRIINFQRERKKRLEKIVRLDKKHFWHPFTQQYHWDKSDIISVYRGRGVTLETTDGKKYLDGNAGYWVSTLGHCEPDLNRAFIRQIGRLAHSTTLGLTNEPAVELARELAQIAPEGLDHVFYSDNGSTAVETALKMSFASARTRPGGGEKTGFISIALGYHGDTVGSVSVGGIDLFHKLYEPLLFEKITAPAPYCYRCALGKSYPECNLACAAEFERLVNKHRARLAAAVVEPRVQCPGGIIVAPDGYLKRIRTASKNAGVTFIADEVATGFGRTGRMFACELESVTPDIICVAKGISGGYVPLAATIVSHEIFGTFYHPAEERKFYHGHTYTGNPVACAVALENVRSMRKTGIVRKVRQKSEFARKKLAPLADHPNVGEIRRQGLIIGIELVKNKTTKEPFPPEMGIGRKVASEALKRGLIIRPIGDVVILFPALTVTTAELGKMIDIIANSLPRTIAP